MTRSKKKTSVLDESQNIRIPDSRCNSFRKLSNFHCQQQRLTSDLCYHGLDLFTHELSIFGTGSHINRLTWFMIYLSKRPTYPRCSMEREISSM